MAHGHPEQIQPTAQPLRRRFLRSNAHEDFPPGNSWGQDDRVRMRPSERGRIAVTAGSFAKGSRYLGSLYPYTRTTGTFGRWKCQKRPISKAGSAEIASPLSSKPASGIVRCGRSFHSEAEVGHRPDIWAAA